MKNILNAVLAGVILYVGSLLFPTSIVIDGGIKTLIIAVIVYMAMDIVFFVIGSVLLIGSVLANNEILAIIVVFVAAVLWTLIKLVLLNKFMPGITFNGVGTYILLALALGIFCVSTNDNKK